MNLRSLLLSAVALIATSAFASTQKITDVNEALSKGQADKKMVFIQYGREACGNCQALKAMIKAGKVRLSPSKFVYADVNCDDAATSRAFNSKFKVSGSTLPFVVIAGPDGQQLAARSGYGSAQDFEKLIKDAEKALKK
jgi:thioredoxin-related protein